MKTNKKLILAFFVLALPFIFLSCSSKSFSDSLTCNELSASLEREISVPDGEFDEYSDDELKFLFNATQLYNDICVLYSKDATDITELGVLHASSEENAKKLYEDTKIYIKDLQQQKSEFLRNYSPSELSKLNSAEARRFGNYIIFTVADQNNRDKIFKKAEIILSK